MLNSLVLGAASSSSAGGYSGIILIILMIALMYFFMIRPQQKQRKQHQEMMNELHKGDEVVTIGRMHGKIDSINQADRTVTLDCEGIYLTFDMVAIARVIKRADEGATSAEVKAEEAANEKAESSATAEVTSAQPATDQPAAKAEDAEDNK